MLRLQHSLSIVHRIGERIDSFEQHNLFERELVFHYIVKLDHPLFMLDSIACIIAENPDHVMARRIISVIQTAIAGTAYGGYDLVAAVERVKGRAGVVA